MSSIEWGQPNSVDLGAARAVFLALGFYGVFMPNPLETIWSVFLLYLILKLFWWQQFPPILVYGTLIPWIEVHFSLLEANYYGETLNELFLDTGRQTFWMASIGLLAIMLGISFGLRTHWAQLIPSRQSLQADALSINQTLLLVSIVATRFLTGILDSIIPYGSGWTQLVTYLGGISDAIAVVFYLQFFLTRQRPWLFTAFFVFELLTSFYSYFGSWKGPVILLFLASMINVKAVTSKMILRFAPILGGTILLVFVWQAVKGEYRFFISGGLQDQTISVSTTDALVKFQELATGAFQTEDEERQSILQGTFRRLGYLEYFAAAVGKVPEQIPYEGGALLKDNLTFALVPRLLNPNKGVKSDRDKIEKYTDFYFGGDRNVSSFSLGHYCEAFIDWGPVGMMLHLLIYGLIGAILWIQVFKRYADINPLLMLGILWVVILPWGTMQQDFITVAGNITWGVVCHLFVFRPIYKKLNVFIEK